MGRVDWKFVDKQIKKFGDRKFSIQELKKQVKKNNESALEINIKNVNL